MKDEPEKQLSLPFSKTKKRKLKRRQNDPQSEAYAVAPHKDIRNGKFIVFVDESGDHSLNPKQINPQFPMFCLAFCVFYKTHYCDVVIPALERFKFKYFGHDQINLHESDIRKETKPFNIFRTKVEKERFLRSLGAIMRRCNYIVIASVIEKLKLSQADINHSNIYNMSMKFCLETLYDFLLEHGEHDALTYIVVEKRGGTGTKVGKEGKEVELEFRRIFSRHNRHGVTYPFDIILIDKTRLSTGLQFADLIARPIAKSVWQPEQRNRAFEILKSKFYCEGGRDGVGNRFDGFGLKVFPMRDVNNPQKVEGH